MLAVFIARLAPCPHANNCRVSRRELEHQWVHRLRSPVALEPEAASPREDGTNRPTARRGRPSAARRPLFHSRADRDESGSARTAGNLPGIMTGLTGVRPGSDQPPRPGLPFQSLLSQDLHYLSAGRTSSSSIPTVRSQPQSTPAPSGVASEAADTTRATSRLRVALHTEAADPVDSARATARLDPADSARATTRLDSFDSVQATARLRAALNTEAERPRRFLRVGAAPRAERFRAEAFRVQTPAERRNDEREFMVQVGARLRCKYSLQVNKYLFL